MMWAILKKWRFVILAGFALFFYLTVVDPLFESILESSQKKKESIAKTKLGWRIFTNDACGYIVSFPSRPFETPATTSNRQNVISYRQFASTLGSNQSFMVATLVTSLSNNFSEDQTMIVLDTTAKGVVKMEDTMLAQRDILIGTNMGREVEFLKADGYYIKMRFYHVGHGLQQLMARVPLADKGTTNISRFLDSFNLISK